MQLTPEQDEIVRASHAEPCLMVEAGAGTGKTTTMVAIARQKPGQRGLLLAFNRLMAETTAPRLAGTSCQARTMHSIAYQSPAAEPFRRNGGKRLGSLLPARLAASAVGLDQGTTRFGPVELTLYDVGDLLKDWVARFCHSADDELGLEHFPRSTLMDALKVEYQRLAQTNRPWWTSLVDAVSSDMLKAARKLWDLMSSPDGDFLSTHDVYLKLYALNKPKFDLDYMILDEAQDANPIMLQLLEQAAQQGVQTILVGDSRQQMYSWRGAVDAMSRIAATRRLRLTQSFRFGPEVASAANGVLQHLIGTDFRIHGAGGPSSIVEYMPKPSAVIARTNAVAIEEALTARSYGLRVGLCLDGKSLLKDIDALEDLKNTGRCAHRRFAKFSSYEELMMAVESGDAPDIKVLVDLIEKIGADAAKEVIAEIAIGKDQKAIEAAKLDTLYLTAHASKGLEFDQVRLAKDFKGPDKTGCMPSLEEANILYVAITRAKHALCMGDSPAVKALHALGVGLATRAAAPPPPQRAALTVTTAPTTTHSGDGVLSSATGASKPVCFQPPTAQFGLVATKTQPLDSKTLASGRLVHQRPKQQKAQQQRAPTAPAKRLKIATLNEWSQLEAQWLQSMFTEEKIQEALRKLHEKGKQRLNPVNVAQVLGVKLPSYAELKAFQLAKTPKTIATPSAEEASPAALWQAGLDLDAIAHKTGKSSAEVMLQVSAALSMPLEDLLAQSLARHLATQQQTQKDGSVALA